MTGEQLQFLRAAPVRAFDAKGIPLLLPNGEPLTRPVELIPATVLERLYADSQDIPLNPDTGYRIGGGGRLEISARSMDLGATAGVVSYGPRANPAFAQRFERGADLAITLAGDLDMFSTRIASLSGGSVQITTDGAINAGSRDFASADNTARGIYTVDRSNFTALAQGNVSVSAGGNVSGTLVGVGSVSASGGGTVDAALLSQNVTTSGDASSAQVGFSQGTAANTATQGTQSEEPDKAATTASKAEDEDPQKLTKSASPRLTRTVGRVTVILP